MALIEFKDLPDTTTPLTASNLNNNFNELDEKIDSVVESGSNANGNYVKYADGTMICTKKVDINTTISNSWGVLYESDKLDLGSYAQPFIESPIIMATPYQREILIAQVREFSTTSFGKINLVKPAADSSTTDYHINLVAIGKWK